MMIARLMKIALWPNASWTRVRYCCIRPFYRLTRNAVPNSFRDTCPRTSPTRATPQMPGASDDNLVSEEEIRSYFTEKYPSEPQEMSRMVTLAKSFQTARNKTCGSRVPMRNLAELVQSVVGVGGSQAFLDLKKAAGRMVKPGLQTVRDCVELHESVEKVSTYIRRLSGAALCRHREYLTDNELQKCKVRTVSGKRATRSKLCLLTMGFKHDCDVQEGNGYATTGKSDHLTLYCTPCDQNLHNIENTLSSGGAWCSLLDRFRRPGVLLLVPTIETK